MKVVITENTRTVNKNLEFSNISVTSDHIKLCNGLDLL